MRCRFNHTRKVWIPYKDAPNARLEERLVAGRHWPEKICPDCRAADKTKADDKRLTANKG